MAELGDERKQAKVVKSIALSTELKNNKRGYNYRMSRDRHKGSSSTLRSKKNKEKCKYYDSKSHHEDFYLKKHLD